MIPVRVLGLSRPQTPEIRSASASSSPLFSSTTLFCILALDHHIVVTRIPKLSSITHQIPTNLSFPFPHFPLRERDASAQLTKISPEEIRLGRAPPQAFCDILRFSSLTYPFHTPFFFVLQPSATVRNVRRRSRTNALPCSSEYLAHTTFSRAGSILFQRHAALLVPNNALCLMSGLFSDI